jgi:putative ABC transport system permease protein
MTSALTSELSMAPPGPRPTPTVAMTTLIAWRNLAHDRVRFFVTLTGIIFSVVLMGMQSGLLLGFSKATSGLIDNSTADLWVVARGTKDVDISTPLDERRRFQALAVPGVESAEPFLINFASWKRPSGGTESVSLVGIENDAVLGGPWNIVEGRREDLERPDAVIVDRIYAKKLGVTAIGETVEINKRKARVVGFSKGIRTFTQSPYVFTSLANAQHFVGAPSTNVGYLLVKVAPGADVATVKAGIEQRIPDVEVFTRAGFAKSSSDYWLYTTGAGFSLIISALLGLVVGIVIVAQTLYASTIDRLPEYATLKAMGAPSSYLYKIIVTQAGMAASIGYTVGIAIVVVLVIGAQASSAAPVLPVPLAIGLGMLTFAMCIGAAIISIRKVMAIDPVGVFR